MIKNWQNKDHPQHHYLKEIFLAEQICHHICGPWLAWMTSDFHCNLKTLTNVFVRSEYSVLTSTYSYDSGRSKHKTPGFGAQQQGVRQKGSGGTSNGPGLPLRTTDLPGSARQAGNIAPGC